MCVRVQPVVIFPQWPPADMRHSDENIKQQNANNKIAQQSADVGQTVLERRHPVLAEDSCVDGEADTFP